MILRQFCYTLTVINDRNVGLVLQAVFAIVIWKKRYIHLS